MNMMKRPTGTWFGNDEKVTLIHIRTVFNLTDAQYIHDINALLSVFSPDVKISEF